MLGNLLNILRRISEIIAKTSDHMVALQKIVDILAENLNVDVCSVYECDERNNRLVLKATYGLSHDAVMNVSMKPGEGLTGTSFKERRIINVANPQSHPNFKLFENIGEEKYRSFLSVPLTVSGKCLGILTIQGTREEVFPQPVVDLVRSISTQLANLILNSIILKGLQDTPAHQSSAAATAQTDQVMLKGVATTPGITFGNVFLFMKEDIFDRHEPSAHQDCEQELALFDKALKLAKQKTLELETKALSLISEADASIFNVHLMFLEDKAVLDQVRKEVVSGWSLDTAIINVYQQYEKRFSQFSDQTFRDKSYDLKDVMLRIVESAHILKNAENEEQVFASSASKLVLVARELLPSDLIRMPVDNIIGIVCEKGGITAHVSILAKALNIPAILGVKGITRSCNDGDEIMLDGHAGRVYVRPGEQVKSHFREIIVPDTAEERHDKVPTRTIDGVEISLKANISLICETATLDQYGARGIGLYRTEFMYMVRDHLPPEDDQYNVFSQIMTRTRDEVTIRVLDVGGDKPLPYIEIPQEDNPALGHRGVRLLLNRKNLFKMHLRAILRAGALGKLRLLFPMVSSLREIIEIKEIVAEVETELHEKNVPHADSYKVGIMVEVPSVLFALDSLIRHFDFMSNGTNYLVQ